MTKAIVLYSGGLDSRLVVKILENQKIDVEALYFNLPFGCGCCNLSCNFNFTQKEKVKMTMFDVTKEPLLFEYLNILKKAKHGRGTSYNPCTDCKIFMLKKAKEYADKKGINIIATGEVLNQRPMSQTKQKKEIIDKEIDFEVLRPLSAKLFEETSFEKKGLIDRKQLFGFHGKNRKPQIELAKKWNIKFPNPGGGCLLCEKAYKKRFKTLIEKKLITEKTLPLVPIGRHFLLNNVWYIVARNQEECEILDKFKETVIGRTGTPSVYLNNTKETKTAHTLQQSFKKGTSKEQRNKFKEYKL